MKLLSRRALEELGTLQDAMQDLAAHRNAALRMFMTSRSTTTLVSQREFWLEFSWVDQEYRAAVRKLAQFCCGIGIPAKQIHRAIAAPR
ncbi:MAG: hypothetical protein ACJ8R9_24030 [Steroidobacteraceae bacterium]